MSKSLRILCVHGVGGHSPGGSWENDWSDIIRQRLLEFNPDVQPEVQFVCYDDLFGPHFPSALEIIAAVAKMLKSCAYHGIADLFRGGRRGLADIPEIANLTAGMVVKWGENPALRKKTRQLVAKRIAEFQPDVVAAHSLGSLICYDTFIHVSKDSPIHNRIFVSFGSQIGSACVRDLYAGRLKPLDAAAWYHLYNPLDLVFTAPIPLDSPNLRQVTTFNLEGWDEHSALGYLQHPQTAAEVWKPIAEGRRSAGLSRSYRSYKSYRKPTRSALLVGINDYPNEADRLEGCVNDVFLVSSVLQECGFAAEDIRVVLNDRATAAGIRERFAWLLDGVKDGDQRVFYYSGHGAQIAGYGVGETTDRLDECLVPYDFDWSRDHAIVDDEIFNLYSQLPYEARFLMILDCCHSGGMPRDGGRRVRGLNPPDDIRHRMLRWNRKEQMWEPRDLTPPNRSLAELRDGAKYLGRSGVKRRLGRAITLRGLENKDYDRVRKALDHKGPYLPMIYEACQEDESAYEYRHGVTSYGAFTYSLAKILRDHRVRGRSLTFDGLLRETADTLKRLRYDQRPSLVGPKRLLSGKIPW